MLFYHKQIRLKKCYIVYLYIYFIYSKKIRLTKLVFAKIEIRIKTELIEFQIKNSNFKILNFKLIKKI